MRRRTHTKLQFPYAFTKWEESARACRHLNFTQFSIIDNHHLTLSGARALVLISELTY